MIWDIKRPALGSDYAKSLEIVTLVLETTKSWTNKKINDISWTHHRTDVAEQTLPQHLER